MDLRLKDIRKRKKETERRVRDLEERISEMDKEFIADYALNGNQRCTMH